MKIGIIHETRCPTTTSRLLLDAIRKLGHEAFYMPFTYLSARIEKNSLVLKIGTQTLNIDGALLRSIGYAPSFEQFAGRLSLFFSLEYGGIYLMNSITSLLYARNKFLTLLKLFKAGIPVPRSLLTENIAEAYRTTKEWRKVVVKPVVGSRGFGQVLVENEDVGYRIYRTCLQFKQFIFLQEFLEKPSRDIRLFVVGDRIVAAMYRYAPPNEWKTNIAQGGKAVPLTPSSELEELAVKTVNILNMDYAGIDIVECKTGFQVLEVNGSPAFEGIMEATHKDIPREIVKYLIEKIKK